MDGMSDLERRSGSRMTRRQREQRAYQLAIAGGGSAVGAVVTTLLAILTPLGATLPIILAILAVVAFVLFRRTVSGR